MPTILFRKSLSEEGELEVCRKYFHTIEQRSLINPDSLIIGRYSVLPYYKELEQDITILGSDLINTYKQHKWIADFEYYNVLKKYTPETWYEQDFYKCDYSGPFVVKGKTNSRKLNWDTEMFATTKKDATKIAGILHNDGYIGSQDIIFRKYIPLKTYEIGIHNLPFTNEWRIFCYKDKILSRGYYWSCASEQTIDSATLYDAGENLIRELVKIASQYVNFYVLDVAQTQEGNWILIEINDGQMSGLSENNPDVLYKNLARVITEEYR